MNLKEIKDKIEEFRITFLGNDWTWRKNQEEAIIKIVESYFNNVKVIILQAETGNGKSIIALCSSWIFNQINKKSYILASDINLQKQYEDDIKRFHLNYGVICGVDHYKCSDNDEKHSLGTCKMRNRNPHEMYCYSECPYFCAREYASQTSTSVLNYAYWLISQNYVNQHIDKPFFPPRDILFADEAHKILDIVQNHYSPKFDKKTLEKLERLTEFFVVHKVNDHIKEYKDIKRNIKNLHDTENQEKIHKILKHIELSFERYLPSWELLKKKTEEDYPHDNPPKQWREALWLCDWLKDLHCKVEDYNDIIDKTSTRNIVKNPSGDNELTFNCLEESYMMNKYFHRWTGFLVLMSATFADPSEYLKSIALKTAKYIKMESLFNYEKSPIYFYNQHRMSYNDINKNLPWLYDKINEILEKYKDENGVIHTVSYDLTMKIFQHIDKKHRRRLLVYSGAEEKRKALEILKRSKNRILMGPSLRDGIDLRSDFARFAIIAKMPYASLTDKFVATKLKIDHEWYTWKTIIEILQSVGRTVRNIDDFCDTFILDACFSDLLFKHRKSFPTEFLQRIHVLHE